MSPLRHTTAAAWVLALAAGLWGPPAQADDVVLHNGNTFDGVIVVSETAERVKIRLAYGEMSLPRSWIARIDRTASPLSGYLQRRQTLRGRADAALEDWLALARWARSRDLRHGYKEALLEAARIEPRHPALAPLLRGLDYVLEEPTGLWVSAAELRRAQAVEEARLRAAAERERRAETRSDDGRQTTEQTLSRAIEALALAELERETRTTERERETRTRYPVQAGGYGIPLYPVTYAPGLVVAPSPAPAPADPAAVPSTRPADPYAEIRGRLPGSVLGSRVGGGRMSSRSRPHMPGSLLQSRPR